MQTVRARITMLSMNASCVGTGPDSEPLVFVGRTAGHVVPARGPLDFGWDPIFQPEGYSTTYAEMDKATKNTISHRYRALDKLRSHLLAQCEAHASGA